MTGMSSAEGDRSSAPDPFGSLRAFSALQRQLAASELSAMTAARLAFQQSATTASISKLALAEADAVAKHFARSIDFRRLATAHKALTSNSAFAATKAAQTQWAESLAKAINATEMNKAAAVRAALGRTAADSVGRQIEEVFARIAEMNARLRLPRIDFDFTHWLPANLRSIENDLDAVATIALEEGLPLGWVPRSEIVAALISAGSHDERHGILIERTNDILDDCEAALADDESEWSRQCRNAIAALRVGLDAPGQSHASNIIDSIVMALHGRDEAKERAQEDLDELPLQVAAENLTLRPLVRALTSWWPHSGDAPPEYFARHVTSHGVGHDGVFAPGHALVAVMLATSLTVQYSQDGSSPADSDT